MAEEALLKAIIEKESWEDVIYYIVNVEKLDPWEVDLIRLTDKFIEFIHSAKELDFRIPAKIIFVAVILLRLKADYLAILEEEEEETKETRPFEELGIDPNLIQLGYPIRRIPKRQITLEELVAALKKALAVERRRAERLKKVRTKLKAQVALEEDITIRIERIMREIEEGLKRSKLGKVGFRQIVEEWKRNKIIDHFIPLLHLEFDNRIKTEQIKWFKEIWITKK